MKLVLFKKGASDRYLITYCCGYLMLNTLHVMASNMPQIATGWSYIYMAVLAGLTIYGIVGLFNKGKLYLLVLTELFILLLFGITYLRQTVFNMSTFLDSMKITCITSLPFALCIHEISDRESLMNTLFKASLISHGFIFIGMFFYISTDYSMGLGYSLLPHTLIMIDQFFEKRKIYTIIIAAVDTVYTIIFCSRGPLLCLVIYVVLRLVFSSSITKKVKAVSSIAVLIGSGLILFFGSSLVALTARIASLIGFNSRTIYLMQINEFLSHDSGRGNILSATSEMIARKPLLGWGLGGGWEIGYPHNFIYEIILSFGFIVGIAVIAFLLYKWISILKSKDYTYQRLGFLFGAVCASGLFSSSIIRGYHFLTLIWL